MRETVATVKFAEPSGGLLCCMKHRDWNGTEEQVRSPEFMCPLHQLPALGQLIEPLWKKKKKVFLSISLG